MSHIPSLEYRPKPNRLLLRLGQSLTGIGALKVLLFPVDLIGRGESVMDIYKHLSWFSFIGNPIFCGIVLVVGLILLWVQGKNFVPPVPKTELVHPFTKQPLTLRRRASPGQKYALRACLVALILAITIGIAYKLPLLNYLSAKKLVLPPPLPPKPPLIASHSLRRSPPKVTVQKSPPLANPNVATLNTVPQAGSTPQPIRPLQPQSAPSGPVESAYFDVANAISNVQSLNDSWLQSLESIAPLDGSPNREKDAPPSEEIRFRYYSDVTQLIDRTNRGWKGLRQTVVDKAVEEALIRMTMVGPKQITPNEASQERRDFENASEIAERKETFSDIENGKINKSRYDPVLTYLRRLHLKLADYPETPTQQ